MSIFFIVSYLILLVVLVGSLLVLVRVKAVVRDKQQPTKRLEPKEDLTSRQKF